MKFLFIGIFILILAALSVIIWTMAIVWCDKSQFDKSSKTFVDNVIPKIISNWSKDDLLPYCSPQFTASLSDYKLDSMLENYKKNFGPLETCGRCTGGANVTYTTSLGRIVMATYLLDAVYINGRAQIAVKLILINKQWYIYGLQVNSPLLNIDSRRRYQLPNLQGDRKTVSG